jgi:hypothetical protein
MIANLTNVIIGAIVVLAVVYYFRPTSPSYEGFESNPGAIIGTIFATILGVGILFALLGSFSEIGKTS